MFNDVDNVIEQQKVGAETSSSKKNEVKTDSGTTTTQNGTNSNKEPSMVMGDKPIGFIERMFELIFKHGFFKSVCAILLILACVMLWQFINALNYEKIAEKVVQEMVEKQMEAKKEHSEGTDIRIHNTPKIVGVLTKAIYELGADRAAVLEMHNGKENPSELPFVYCDMTYEETRDRTPYVSDEYSDMNMGKYHFFTYLMDERIFTGSTDELWSIDKKFASKVQTNDAQYIAMVVIKNEVEIGFFVVSFLHQPTIDKHKLEVKLTDFAQELGYLLDMTPKSPQKTK